MPEPPSRFLRAATLAAVLAVAACGPSAAAPGMTGIPSAVAESGEPGPTPAASFPADAIAHPTGATDIVLRVAVEGGFVRLETVMGRVPVFTLYGDGRVLLLPADQGLDPEASPRLHETRLTEEQVQELLRFALTDGGLGTAREDYGGMLIDAPATVFTIDTSDVANRVAVGGLSSEPEPGPDAVAIRALAALLAALQSIPAQPTWDPAESLAVLAETQPAPGVAADPWPWPDLAPADFAQPGDGDPVPFPRHLLTAAQAAAAGADAETGAAILTVDGPDGRSYLVLVRPALPEEIAAPG